MGKSPRTRFKGTIKPFVSTRSYGYNLATDDPYILSKSSSTHPILGHGATVRENSTMFDYVSDNYEFGDKPVKAVDHIYLSRGMWPKSVTTYHNAFPFDGYTDWYFEDGAFRQLTEMAYFDSWFPLPPSDFMSRHARNAVKVMTLQFPTEISIANTLAELKEIPELAEHIREINTFLQVFEPDKRYRRKLSVQNVATIHAGHNFGVSPLIGDLIKIDQLWKIVDARLQHLRRTKGRWVRTGHSSKFETAPEKLIGTYSSSIPGEAVRLVHSKSTFDIKSVALVKNDLAWVDTWEGIVRGFIGVMGLDNPLSIAWEAVPYSWAIDYVLPVGDWLETLKFQDVTAWRVKRMTTSVKQTIHVRVELQTTQESFREIGSFELTRYTRNVGLPPLLGGISSPNAKQLSLLAAVATGRA